MNPWSAIAGLLVGGAAVWFVQDWRFGETIATMEREHARQQAASVLGALESSREVAEHHATIEKALQARISSADAARDAALRRVRNTPDRRCQPAGVAAAQPGTGANGPDRADGIDFEAMALDEARRARVVAERLNALMLEVQARDKACGYSHNP